MNAVAILLALASLLQQAESQAMNDARAKFRAQDYGVAAQLFEAVTRDEPDNGQAWYLYGYSLHALGITRMRWRSM